MNPRSHSLIPTLLLSLLGGTFTLGAGEPPAPVNLQALDRRIDQALYDVIIAGTQLYNNGDHTGCCRIFEGGLVSMRPVLAHRPALQRAITDGLTKAGTLSIADERARQLRAVMDRVREGLRPEPAAPAKTAKPNLDKTLPTPGGLVLSAQERVLLELTNQERAKKKLPPLRPNAELFAAARNHSANMAKQNKMAHELDGQAPGERVRAAGYVPFNWGENIASGYSTAAEAVAGWMSSEGHRDNMLNPSFTEIGLGIVADERGNLFYTQVFGTPWRP